jgi:peptidoglycan/LPS O-acetylase OafA/YrhL
MAPRRWVVPICLVTAWVSVTARTGFELYFVVPVRIDPLIERLLLSRCDGFALGGLLAAALADADRVRRHRRRYLAALAAALLVSGAYLARGYARGGAGFLGLPTPSDPGLTIFMVEVFYASIVGLVLLHAGRPVLAPLRVPLLCYLGLISYGIYMYHSPIYWAIDGFGRVDTWLYDQPLSTKALKLAAALGAAMASWHLIERPILGLKDRFEYGRPAARAGPAESAALAVPAGAPDGRAPDDQAPGP